MKTDIDIAQAAKLEKISIIAKKINIPEDSLEPYGHYKAKISLDFLDSLEDKKDGKLILVTAISPTPAGEGKTTTSVGLGDALNSISNHKWSQSKIIKRIIFPQRNGVGVGSLLPEITASGIYDITCTGL